MAEAISEQLRTAISDHCVEIESLFQPGCKISVVVRNPEHDKTGPHSAAVWVSSDDPLKVIDAINCLTDAPRPCGTDIGLTGELTRLRVENSELHASLDRAEDRIAELSVRRFSWRELLNW